jgi:hypothetical protein
MEQVHSVTTGRVALGGYDDARPLRLVLRDVVIKGKPQVKTEFALFDGQLNAPDAKAVDCSSRFEPFPGDDAQ